MSLPEWAYRYRPYRRPGQMDSRSFGSGMQNGKIFGRGATDCKSGVTAMVIAAEAISKINATHRGDIILAMVTGEETLRDKGTGYLLNEGRLNADAAVVDRP